MKKRDLMRLITFAVALLLFLPLCLQSAAALGLDANSSALPDSVYSAEAAGSDLDLAVFLLCFLKGEEEYVTQAFYVQDTNGDGCTYLITTGASTSLVEEGFMPYLAKDGYFEQAVHLCTKGNFGFYYAPGLLGETPFQTGTIFTAEMAVFFQNADENGNFYLDATMLDITGWKDYGSHYIQEGSTLNSTLYLGAPAVETQYGQVAGLIASSESGEPALVSMLDLKYPAEAALYDASGNAIYEAKETEKAEEEAKHDKTVYIIASVAVVGVIILAVTRKSKPSKTVSAPANTGETVALEPNSFEPISPVIPINPIPTVPTVKWQVRALEGKLEGRTFLLNDVLRFGRSPGCAVTFPQNAPGISAEHCELCLEAGRVVLRDLNSTYGTYLNKTMKLQARVGYNLQLGDTFTLAENGQTFRLEKAGEVYRELTPAVRCVGTGETFRADMQGRLAFGRDGRNQVCFDGGDSAVSSMHCVLYREGSQLYLKDNGSTNGTFFAENKRLRPNTPYKVKKGVSFFLVSPKHTYIITEE